MRTREARLVKDSSFLDKSAEPRYREAMSAVDPRSGTVAPLCIRDTTLGTVTFLAAESRRS